jgi:hypothetical protein
MFGTFTKGKTGEKPTHTGFEGVAWSNDFYQELIYKAEKDGSKKVFEDRAATKGKLIRILFDDGPYLQNDAAFKLFSSWYPRESKLILLIKEAGRNAIQKESKIKGVAYLPILLQRVESYLILEKVCKQISKQHPTVPLIPVHDCIMTTVDNQEIVARIMKDVLTLETGLKPGITQSVNDFKLQVKSIREAAPRDIEKILNKKPKGNIGNTGLRSPLMTFSEWNRIGFFIFDSINRYIKKYWLSPNVSTPFLLQVKS